MKDRIVAGRYELLGLIGQGGTARVFRAFDRVLGREVAIKIVDERAAFDPVYLERFKREAQAAARLNHPNIVTIHDWGEARSNAGGAPTYFMVMEHVEGADLGDLIARRGPLPIPEALSYADAIAAALQTAHAQGIVHRDVKPQNVMIQPDGRVKVTDFGIARQLDLTPLTEPNMVSGTAQYLAPEQARGGAIDARSDLYSLGIVLYEMLTGRTPFAGGSPVDVAMKHVSEVPSPPSRLRPDVPESVDALVMRALAKKPEDRFAGLSGFRSALAAASRSEPVAPPSRTSAPRRRIQSRTAIVPVTRSPRWEQWMWIVPLLVVLLAGGLAYGVVGSAFNSHGRHVALHHGSQVAAKSTATATTPVPRKSVKSSPTAKPSRTVKPAPVTVKHPPTVAKPSPTPIPATATPRPAVAAGPPRGAAPHPHASPARPRATPQSTPPQIIAAASTSGSADPASAVLAFYRLVAAHQYTQAAQLWTASMQQLYPPATNIDGRFAQTAAISARASDESINPQAGTATVAVDVVETMTSGTQREWVGTWTLVRTSNGWLLNYPDLRSA